MNFNIDLKSMLIGFLMSTVIFLFMGLSSYSDSIKVIMDQPIKLSGPIEFEFKQSWKPIKVEIKD